MVIDEYQRTGRIWASVAADAEDLGPVGKLIEALFMVDQMRPRGSRGPMGPRVPMGPRGTTAGQKGTRTSCDDPPGYPWGP